MADENIKGALAYFPIFSLPIALIFYLMEKDNKKIKNHAINSIGLAIAEIVVQFGLGIAAIISFLLMFVLIGFLLLPIVYGLMIVFGLGIFIYRIYLMYKIYKGATPSIPYVTEKLKPHLERDSAIKGSLAYLPFGGYLAIFNAFMIYAFEKKDYNVKFHALQSLVLWGVEFGMFIVLMPVMVILWFVMLFAAITGFGAILWLVFMGLILLVIALEFIIMLFRVYIAYVWFREGRKISLPYIGEFVEKQLAKKKAQKASTPSYA
jgi:uncharacterized membrane protein